MLTKISLALFIFSSFTCTLAGTWSPPNYVVKYDTSVYNNVDKLCETERDDCVQIAIQNGGHHVSNCASASSTTLNLFCGSIPKDDQGNILPGPLTDRTAALVSTVGHLTVVSGPTGGSNYLEPSSSPNSNSTAAPTSGASASINTNANAANASTTVVSVPPVIVAVTTSDPLIKIQVSSTNTISILSPTNSFSGAVTMKPLQSRAIGILGLYRVV